MKLKIRFEVVNHMKPTQGKKNHSIYSNFLNHFLTLALKGIGSSLWLDSKDLSWWGLIGILNVNIGTCVLSPIQENKKHNWFGIHSVIFFHIKKFLALPSFLVIRIFLIFFSICRCLPSQNALP